MLVLGRRRLLAVVVAAVVSGGVALSGCSTTSAGAGDNGLTNSPGASVAMVGVTKYAVGQRPEIPDISGQTLDGGQIALDELRGHIVVLNTWASYCTPCRTESPALAKVAQQTARLGVRFVGINEHDNADSARTFAAAAGVSYPQLVDRQGTVLASLRLVPPSAVPSTLVLDRTGRVAARIIGPVDGPTLMSLVRNVAAEGSTSASPAS